MIGQKHEREALAAAREEAEKFGMTVEAVRRTAHLVLEARLGSQARRFTVACSPRTDNQARSSRQKIRAIARQLGVAK